jgi:phosphoheptose isomerase
MICIIRINSLGQLQNARPCINCYKQIKASGIKTIYYSTDDGTFKKEYTQYFIAIQQSSFDKINVIQNNIKSLDGIYAKRSSVLMMLEFGNSFKLKYTIFKRKVEIYCTSGDIVRIFLID